MVGSSPVSRREFLATTASLLSGQSLLADPAGSVSVYILKLLHPKVLEISATGSSRLNVTTPDRIFTLEGHQSLHVDASKTPVNVTATSGGPARFTLTIPSVIRRSYEGSLHITALGELLIPVVTMPNETAVSSITSAEIPQSGSPLAALAAQAIVARSFLAAAGKRHAEADFCDTTHCQFLRSPAQPGSQAALATAQTAGVVLDANSRTVAARYSAACGGHTDAGEESGYLYQRVTCEICKRSHTARAGHGHGLCQTGAIGFAQAGWAYLRILEKYLPGTQLAKL
jgi:peptidoglycan hydrolase-like amidase